MSSPLALKTAGERRGLPGQKNVVLGDIKRKFIYRIVFTIVAYGTWCGKDPGLVEMN